MNTSPLQLAALRAGLLHISNSEQGHNSPAFCGCPSALSLWHTELSLNDRASVTEKSLSGGGLRCSFYCVTSLKIALEVQIHSLASLVILSSSGKTWLHTYRFPQALKQQNPGKKHQHVINSPDIQLWFLGALCEQSCTSKNPYLISFRCQPDGQGSLVEKQCFKGSRTDTWNSSNADANLSPPLPNMSHWATSSSTYSLPSFQLSLFCPLCKISVPLIHFYIEVMNNTTQLYLTVENTCICNWKPSGNLGREQDIKAEALLKGSLENLRKQ